MIQTNAAPPGRADLDAADISKRFGGVQALDGAEFHCHRGETHVLIGENGAGKSTLVKIICGVITKDSGEITIDGKQAVINNSQDARRYGIAAVFQELSLIPYLSVAENIFLGNEPVNRLGMMNHKRMYQEAQQFLSSLSIELNPRTQVQDLALSDMQMVEIAKAVHKQPQILILDEATSALGEKEVRWLFNLMERLKRENKAIIYISHRMDELRQVADRATIFRDARYIMTFPWGELEDRQIVEHISGKKQSTAALEKRLGEEGVYALEVENVCRGSVLNGVSFQLKKGEILGIAGLSGQGQTELLHGLYGDGRFDSGAVKVNGKPVRLHNERQALKNEIALVSEDRKNDGLLLSHPVGVNLTLMSLQRIKRFGILSKRLEAASISSAVEKLQIKVSDTGIAASSLSGGNQQKVVISKVLMTGAKVILLSDPTRGIDIGTKNEIYRLMVDLVGEGYSILFYSTEMTELLMCNRVLVLYEGRVAAELVGEAVTEANMIAQSIGIGGGIDEA